MNSYSAGMQWRTGAGGNPSGLTSGNTWSEYDAFSRYDALRYDSPALGPVTIAASVGNGNRWEIAGRANTSFGGGKFSAALFYGQDHGRTATDNERMGGSASFLFGQGTSITAAYARQEQDVTGGVDSDVWSVKLGHMWGPHSVSGTFGICDECGGQDVEHTTFGFAYVHSLKKANTQIYAAFVHEELDLPGGTPSVDDHNAVVVGARVRFD